MNNINEPHIEVQQQLTFADSEVDVSTVRVPMDHRTITQHGMDISHFFERPMNIYSSEWDDNTSFFQTFSPWYDYFSRPAIRQKLRGFSRMTCEGLEVDFRINGSPFRYGAILASYRPLFSTVKRYQQTESDNITRYYPVPNAEFSGGHILEDGVSDPGYQATGASSSQNVTPSGGTVFTLLPRSQRQHVYLDVASSRGGKMILPFIHPKEALQLDFCSLQYGSEFNKYRNRSYFMRSLDGMGTIFLESLHDLRNLQTATTNGVQLQVYVKPIGVKVWLASATASYDQQGLSTMLSNFWSSSKTPTPVASNSQVVILNDKHDQGEKPTIQGFASRECLLSMCTWATSDGTNTALLGIPVHPMHRYFQAYSSTISPNMNRMILTPAAFVAMNYRFWRGTMKINLRVIGTQYHKGRLRVTWEPDLASYNSVNAATGASIEPLDPLSQSFLWDISTSSEVNFTVGFGATTDRLNVPPLESVGIPYDRSVFLGPVASFNTNNFTLDNFRDYCNGILMVHVENKLQAPSDCTVNIVASISFPDLELYDAVSQTVSVDALASNSSHTDGNSEYAMTTALEEDLCTNQYAMIPNLSTRPHVANQFIPQGVGTEPYNLDQSKKLDFEFQPTTHVPSLDVMTQETLMDLVLRETIYDVHQFEVPMAQECGTNTVVSNKKGTGVYYPPYLIKGVMPVVPGNYGTTSPCRSMMYNKNMEGTTANKSVGYQITVGTTTRYYSVNLARTQLSQIIKECYVGYKSSYKWRFSDVASNGLQAQYISLERVNTGRNGVLGSSHERTGSYPTLYNVYPYDLTYYVGSNDTSSAPSQLYPVNVVVKSLNYNYDTSDQVVDTGTDVDYPKWYTRFGDTASKFTNVTMMDLRKRLVTGLGSFLSGGVYGASSIATHVPYFARTRFMPGSCLGWMFSESNQESSHSLAFTAVTKAECSYVFTTFVDTSSGAGNWNLLAGVPKHATVSFMSSVAPGDDYTVFHYVNVPNLYVTLSDPFTDAINDL